MDVLNRGRWKIITLHCAILLLLAHVSASHTQAGTGEVISTPPNGVRNTTGLNLTIDTQWVDASGYRVVRVHLATANGVPSTSDRELSIELAPSSYGAGEGKFIVQQFVTLPQGTTSVTEQILVPQNQPWQELQTTVYIDGSHSRQHSTKRTLSNTVGGEWSEAVPAILVIDNDAPSINARSSQQVSNLVDARALVALVSRTYFDEQANLEFRDKQLLRSVATTPRLELLPAEEIPQRWIGLTCFDLVIIDQVDLLDMSGRQPIRFQALIDWVATGGNLLVFGMGDDYEKLNSAENTLALTPQTNDGDYELAGWKAAQKRHYHDGAVRTYQSLQQYGYGYGSTIAYEDAEPTPPRTDPTADKAFNTTDQIKFLQRPLGMGMVLAMGAEDPFPGSTTEWSWVLNTIGENRTMWYRRHGLSLRRKNNDYWEFLVPDTGKAPVLEFCVLITLFAILIGPVNYFVLARQRRLYLLLLTIPLGAALVTICLVGYAVIADGLGTQVRVRSYTLVDQTTGRSVNWARQSYYAGLAPSRGLTFPADTAVYTVEQFPHHEEDHRWQRQRVMHWQDADQNLRSGYMTSRITTQLLTVRTGESSAALQIDRRDRPKSARNQLGGEIRLVLLRDAGGQFYMSSEVPAGEKLSLESAKFAEVKADISAMLLDVRPENPEGLDPNQFDRFWGRQWYGWNVIDSQLTEPRAATSLLEERLRWLQNVQEKDFPSATYIAIVESEEETPIGIGGQESGSLHIIEGKF